MKPLQFVAIITLFTVINVSGCKKDDDAAPVVPTGSAPINFGSHDFGTVQDIEGNTYKTIVIGTATWMAQNLHTTKNRDGDNLVLYTDGNTWRTTTAAAYFDYGGPAKTELYGYLYNEAAKNSVCPSGWHLPTDGDWLDLAGTLGGIFEAGGKLKEEGTAHWRSPNLGGTNSSGFTGIPAGSIHLGNLGDSGSDGYWWSEEVGNFYYTSSSKVELRNKSTALPDEGLAIRCVKNN